MTPLLELSRVSKHFRGKEGRILRAVEEVSLTLAPGETLGIVGESGSGKSTLGRLMLGLHQPTAGRVCVEGVDLGAIGGAKLRQLRRHMQPIFQDPYASLDPRFTVGASIAEPLVIHRIGDAAARSRKVADLLEIVGLEPDAAKRYPHEFSGGQRQRVGIARAIALEPRLIVADEPVSALDVSIQSQILNLLIDLKARLKLSYVFISHDLAVVEHISDRVAVMYLGRIVEIAETGALYRRLAHPYTEALMSAVPEPDLGAPARAHHPGRRRAQSGGPSARLPLPSALSEGLRALPERSAGGGRSGNSRFAASGEMPPSYGRQLSKALCYGPRRKTPIAATMRPSAKLRRMLAAISGKPSPRSKWVRGFRAGVDSKLAMVTAVRSCQATSTNPRSRSSRRSASGAISKLSFSASAQGTGRWNGPALGPAMMSWSASRPPGLSTRRISP